MKNFQFSIINSPLVNPIHNTKTFFDTTMIIQLQLSDKAYERLLASGSRLQGTIGLVNPNEGNFNEHVRHTSNGNGDYFKHLYEEGKFVEKTSKQYYDPEAKTFLADRYITGTCPHCGNEKAYGDQCEACGTSLAATDLINPKSALSGAEPSQSDYNQATRGGGNGDYNVIVLAPASVQEMADFVDLAFSLAFKYRTPAMILSDGVIGQMMEKVVLPVYLSMNICTTSL